MSYLRLPFTPTFSKIIKFSFYIFVLCSLVSNNSLGDPQNINQNNIVVTPLSNEMFMLSGKGGNVVVYTGNEGVLLIDSQSEKSVSKIISSINQITDNKPIKYVINTHWHHDHTGGNELLTKNGSKILAHELVQKRLSTKQFVDFLKREFPPVSINALPSITYNETITLFFNDEKIDIYHTPNSHTDGDSIIYFNKNNVIHTGDIFINERYPFIDLSSGGSLKGIIKAIEKIIEITNKETKIIPGHGPVSNLEQLEEYLFMLNDIRQKVDVLMADGADLNQIIASNITENYDYIYSDKFVNSEDFLRFVYEDMSNR